MIAVRRPRPRRPVLPAGVVAAVGLSRGERVLAFAAQAGGGYLVGTTWRIVAVGADGVRRLSRPWHEVDCGVWQDSTRTVTVSWTDGSRPGQWHLNDEASLLPEALRERVQASVVLAQPVQFDRRRSARVAIRADLQTGELVPQVIYGRGLRQDDPLVAAQVQLVLDDLRDQAGLPSQGSASG